MATTPANDGISNAALWHVFPISAVAVDLGAYAAAHSKAKIATVAFQCLGTGTVVVKRQIDDAPESVPAVPDRVVRGQCSELTSTDVAVIFYWA